MENHPQSMKIQCHYCSSTFPTKLALKHHIEGCVTKFELLHHTRTRGNDSGKDKDVSSDKDTHTDTTTTTNTASTVNTVSSSDKADQQG